MCNVAEDHAGAAVAHIEGNGVGNFDPLPSTVISYLDSVKIKASENGSKCVALSATLEASAALFEGEGQIEYLQMAGLNKVPHVQDTICGDFCLHYFLFQDRLGDSNPSQCRATQNSSVLYRHDKLRITTFLKNMHYFYYLFFISRSERG